MIRDGRAENQGDTLVYSGQRSSFMQWRKRKRDSSSTGSPMDVKFTPRHVRRRLNSKSMDFKERVNISKVNLDLTFSNPSTPIRKNKALRLHRARTPLRLRMKSTKRLTTQQLKKLYTTCTNLLAQNRISEENSWDYNFIEHFHDMVFSTKIWKSSSTSKKNVLDFVTAGYLIATSTKFYSCRVDSLARSTYKVLGGLSSSGILQNIKGDERRTKKKKVRKNTLEKKETLSMNMSEQFSKINPLFHKMTSLFDAGGSKNLLLNFLNIDSAGVSILLDGEQKFLAATAAESNDDQVLPSLKAREWIIHRRILPTSSLYDCSIPSEGEASGGEINTFAHDSIAPVHAGDDLHDLASVGNTNDFSRFGANAVLDTIHKNITEKPVTHTLPGGGIVAARDWGPSDINISADEEQITEEEGSSDSSSLNDLTATLKLLSEDLEKSSFLQTCTITGTNWTGNPCCIRRQLNRVRRKKAEALKIINELKIKQIVTKEINEKVKLDFSFKNILSLPSPEDAYVQMNEKEMNSSSLSIADPETKFTSSGSPITSEWNLLPNDLYFNAHMFRTLFLSPEFNVLKPLDVKFLKQRGYSYIPTKTANDNFRESKQEGNQPYHDICCRDVGIISSLHLEPEYELPLDEPKLDMLQTENDGIGPTQLNIVKFKHKWAAGMDVVDHSVTRKFALKPQPRPQDILYLKRLMGKFITEKRSQSFKKLMGDVLGGLSCKSRSRLNFGSCLLVLLTIANREFLCIERTQGDIFGDFMVYFDPGREISA